MRRVLVVKTGSTLPGILEARGDFDDWIVAAMGLTRDVVEVVDAHRGAPLPDPSAPAGVVVTGSPAMVSDREAWSERAGEWLVRSLEAGTPILGICYGHQLLAQALGGEVGPNPRGREIGTVPLALVPDASDDPLLGALGASTSVQVTHVESVLALPDGARVLASSQADPHHVYALGERTWGVQFHPEFDADVMRRYVDARAQIMRDEGLDPEAIRAEIRETPAATALLSRFVSLLDGFADHPHARRDPW
jgi:GMP synthase (glutamine-hydrolysing)